MIHVSDNNVEQILSEMTGHVYVVLTVIERHHVQEMNPMYYDYYGFLPVFTSEQEAKEKFPDQEVVKLEFKP